jgi:hypothetical protein
MTVRMRATASADRERDRLYAAEADDRELAGAAPT